MTKRPSYALRQGFVAKKGIQNSAEMYYDGYGLVSIDERDDNLRFNKKQIQVD